MIPRGEKILSSYVYVCFSFPASYLAKMKYGKSYKEHSKIDFTVKTAEGYAAFHNFWRHH